MIFYVITRILPLILTITPKYDCFWW